MNGRRFLGARQGPAGHVGSAVAVGRGRVDNGGGGAHADGPKDSRICRSASEGSLKTKNRDAVRPALNPVD